MNLEYTPCAYHPKKIAVANCHRCKRAIYLEDKRTLTQRSSSSSSSISYDFCIICYASQLQKRTKSLMHVPLVFIDIFILVFIML